MTNSNIKLNVNDIPKAMGAFFRKLGAYRVFIFFLLVASLYGYILWRINAFSNIAASTSDIAGQAAAQPHIDEATVEKIQSLQDNSVSVQSLFDSARQNPFQE